MFLEITMFGPEWIADKKDLQMVAIVKILVLK
jgi:hypothetical protein